MADYRTPLPALLAGAVEAGINQLLAMDEAAAQRSERLRGKLLRVDLDGFDISLWFSFAHGSVQVELDGEREPDTCVRGTPMALFAMAAPEEAEAWGLPGSGVRIEGDANLARDLGKVFGQLDPDWRAPLASLFGDTLGYQFASALEQAAGVLRNAARTARDFAQERYAAGQGELIAWPEMREFSSSLERLRDGIDRLEARLRELERGPA